MKNCNATLKMFSFQKWCKNNVKNYFTDYILLKTTVRIFSRKLLIQCIKQFRNLQHFNEIHSYTIFANLKVWYKQGTFTLFY